MPGELREDKRGAGRRLIRPATERNGVPYASGHHLPWSPMLYRQGRSQSLFFAGIFGSVRAACDGLEVCVRPTKQLLPVPSIPSVPALLQPPVMTEMHEAAVRPARLVDENWKTSRSRVLAAAIAISIFIALFGLAWRGVVQASRNGSSGRSLGEEGHWEIKAAGKRAQALLQLSMQYHGGGPVIQYTSPQEYSYEGVPQYSSQQQQHYGPFFPQAYVPQAYVLKTLGYNRYLSAQQAYIHPPSQSYVSEPGGYAKYPTSSQTYFYPLAKPHSDPQYPFFTSRQTVSVASPQVSVQ